MPILSVIIPTYNRRGSLEKTISTVLSQTFEDYKLIIIDDAGTDDTEDYVRSIKHKHVDYIKHGENLGPSEARNTGIKKCDTKYIAFIDDDDEWLPQKLEKQLKTIESCDPDYGAVYTGYYWIDKDSNKLLKTVLPEKHGSIYSDLLYDNCITGSDSTIFVKRECFENVGLFDSGLRYGEDWEMWLRIADKYKYSYVGEPLAIINDHDYNHSKIHLNIIKGIDILTAKYKNDYMKNPRAHSNCLYKKGLAYCQLGEVKKGRGLLFDAIKLYPYNSRYYFYFTLSLLNSNLINKYLTYRKQTKISTSETFK